MAVRIQHISIVILILIDTVIIIIIVVGNQINIKAIQMEKDLLVILRIFIIAILTATTITTITILLFLTIVALMIRKQDVFAQLFYKVFPYEVITIN